MPKGRNVAGGGRKARNPSTDCGHVTVYDYAHANGPPKSSERESKAHRNQLVPREFEPPESLLDWDERSLESYDVEIDSLIGQKEVAASVLETAHGPKKKKKGALQDQRPTGPQYPIDVWFLIAKHVRPEDTGRFAGICQTTHLVTHTAHFWMQMYSRIHSRYKCDLPDELQPHALERIHGLRERVIRSVHCAYPPYATPANSAVTGSFSDDLCKLEGSKCVSSWYLKKTRNLWHLFFKFKRPDVKCGMSEYSDDMTSFEGYHLLKGFSDLHNNPNEGCFILRVGANTYTSSISAAMGLYLVSIGVSVNRCMRYHKLKLVLDSRPYVKSQNAESKIVVIDPTMSARVFAWWQPDYAECSRSQGIGFGGHSEFSTEIP